MKPAARNTYVYTEHLKVRKIAAQFAAGFPKY
jgi:hypothetical protein